MNECYVLHTVPWKETSLIVEILSSIDGRVGLIAKGARRPRSVHRGLLQPFQRLNLRYGSRGNLKTLIAAEWDASINSQINGKRIFFGFYINELLMKLLQKNEVCSKLFFEYEKTLIALTNTLIPAEIILRRFEIFLLLHMGVLPDFRSVSKLQAKDKTFFVTLRDGIKVIDESNNKIIKEEKRKYLNQYNEIVVSDQFVSFSTVSAIASYDQNIDNFILQLSDPITALETKKLLRFLISNQLGGIRLQSRKLLIELTNFSKLVTEGM